MEPGKKPAEGACDHTQPADIARMGEAFLLARNIPEIAWEGSRFGYGGDGGTGPFKSVYTEIERRNGQWVVVKIDRSKLELPAGRAGFQPVTLPGSPIII